MMRLPRTPTQRIDRERELSFLYRGKRFKGLWGDTIATALYANGVRVFSRSLKYHRPRGLYNLDGHSAHCLMSVDGEPMVRACAMPLRQGMVVAPQNVIGSPEWDLLGIFQAFHFAMPAGFYYKRFHKPARLWPVAQKALRRLAGVGKIDPGMPAARYENRCLNAEVCVLGGGSAGMAAAMAAAGTGVRVVLVERRDRLGGSLNYRTLTLGNGLPAYLHGANLVEEVLACENIRVLLSTAATGIYQSSHVTALQRGGPEDPFRLCSYEIRAGSVVVASGAIERPLIFQNNDMPGIMQGSCAQQLVNSYGLKPGKRAVISGCHDGLLEVALDLSEAGVHIEAVAEARTRGFDPEAESRIQGRGIPFLPGHVVARAKGCRALRGVFLEPVEGGRSIQYECDVLVASAGEAPLSQLLETAGAEMVYDPAGARFLPGDLPPRVYGAGRAVGLARQEAIELHGKEAGLLAVKDAGLGVSSELGRIRDALSSLPGPETGWRGPKISGGGYWRFVSFDEDVTVGQIQEAVEEGFDCPELVKRFTGAGTGPSQSYLSGQNLALVMAEVAGAEPGTMKPSRVRPPVEPVSLAVLGGRQHHPAKRTPLYGRQKALGARFRLAGEWERASHFGDERAHDEILNVRNNVGFIDVSTLGKFRVHGPDALKLLQRVYVGDMARVGEGKLSYSIMCNEEGVVVDDGVITNLGENDYFLTTSTLRAPYTCEWLSFHSKEESWDAHAVNLTDAFAAINLAGPRSREVLSRLAREDVSNEAFPFMGFRRLTLCGDMRAMVARIGFVGEMCYEIHVPASLGAALHEAIEEAGKPMGIRPFGLEAQSVLRLEKGHVIIVVDTDNHTTLHEIGMTRLWASRVTDAETVGAPVLRFAEKQMHRERLVGFMMENPEQTPPDGSIVVARGEVRGRVCTCRYSPTLKASIGMALVEPGLAAVGGDLDIYRDRGLVKERIPEKKTMRAKVVAMPFYDPKGERLRR
jgi:sarcosine oxidase, subunit alpha